MIGTFALLFILLIFSGFFSGSETALGRVPAAGEVVERDDVRTLVVASTDTQVTRARIRRR